MLGDDKAAITLPFSRADQAVEQRRNYRFQSKLRDKLIGDWNFVASVLRLSPVT
jgi:hypothetical protein